MKSVYILIASILLSATLCHSQIKNAKNQTIKIYGNCTMCKNAIEKAGNVKNIARLEWIKDTKMAMLTYDRKKTSADDILKRVALAGYDSEYFLTPDDAYAQLPQCCQYSRDLKPIAKANDEGIDTDSQNITHNNNQMDPVRTGGVQTVSQLNTVFDNYFFVKDALVGNNAINASAKATALLKTIKTIKKVELSHEEHKVWTKVSEDLTSETQKIAASEHLPTQREAFALLSKNMYDLAKVARNIMPIYYQHCPMYNKGKGASWLSKEEAVKNPYYGSQMLSCGNTIEVIK